ncbi:hypothetical protein PAXRUDRAFT_21600, partial [Paxillus rubicundulus Ve08.2h10]
GILLDLERQSELNEATANTWSNAVNVINGELSVVRRLLQNITGVHVPPLLIAAQMMAQTNEEIWLSQQWPALLEVRLMRDGIDAHPWSRLHLPMAPKASSARAPSIEVIDKARPLSTAVTATAPPAVKVEQVVGDIKMGDPNSNNNNVVSKAIAKGKGKERAAIEEVGEDAGQEVTVKTVAKEAKGKGKAKEVGEERAVKQGKGKGKGKEVVQEEGVTEQTTVTEKSKNKGKWRESSKATKKTRGRSQSTATLSTKRECSRSHLPPTETASTPQSQAPRPSKKHVRATWLKRLVRPSHAKKGSTGWTFPSHPALFHEAPSLHAKSAPSTRPAPPLPLPPATRRGPEGPLPENQEGGGYNTPSAPSVDSPANPLPPLPTIPKLTATPTVLTALEVDTRSTTAMGSAVQEQHAVVPISAAQVDAQVDVVEAEGVAEPSTPLALPVRLPPPSPEHRATALLALTMAYDNEEQMEVDN